MIVEVPVAKRSVPTRGDGVLAVGADGYAVHTAFVIAEDHAAGFRLHPFEQNLGRIAHFRVLGRRGRLLERFDRRLAERFELLLGFGPFRLVIVAELQNETIDLLWRKFAFGFRWGLGRRLVDRIRHASARQRIAAMTANRKTDHVGTLREIRPISGRLKRGLNVALVVTIVL